MRHCPNTSGSNNTYYFAQSKLNNQPIFWTISVLQAACSRAGNYF